MTFLKNMLPPSQFFRRSLFVLATIGLMLPGASMAQSPVPSASSVELEKVTAGRPGTHNVLANGTYLFGESPESNQMGVTYAVVAIESNRAVGVFYQPRSSFDCFFGEVLPNQLAVNVIDSYEQAVYPYSIALTLNESLVAGEAAESSYTLEGFHQIDALSERDREMLAICQADVADR
ncbi:MAG: hypothetical protein HC800_18135 [Phormidesmis sp. RL_2_1]|nr:hypothetical protein [Phormidesmis sp. RL_2_1]